MARITETFGGKFFSIIDVGTDAATDTINCLDVMCPLISRITSSTTCGFTPITIMSAPLAAATLSVPTFTFSFAASALARSSWATVALVDFAESIPFFSRAWRIMPPIFPAPRNATFFPVRSFPISSSDPRSRQIVTTEDTEFHREIPCVPRCPLWLSAFRLCLPLHKVPCGRDHVAQPACCLPLQQGLRLRRIGHEYGRVARPPRNHLVRHALPRRSFDGGNHFLHRGSGSGSNVHRETFLPFCQVIERLQMCTCQIVHVNIVTHARSIGCWIVRPKHLQLRADSRRRAQSQWNQMRLRFVQLTDLPAFIRARRIEIAQAGEAKTVSAIIRLQCLLKEQFRYAVRIHRLPGRALLDRNFRRLPIHCAGRRKNNRLHACVERCVEQR